MSIEALILPFFKAESMVKPFYKDEYATLELDDSIRAFS